jgi:hypothetical protein
VPVSVWRAASPQDLSTSAGAVYGGLTPRLAARLLAIYTDPGQIVVDTTSDPAVAGAAGAGGRRYLALRLPCPPRQAGDLAGRAGLILLLWPPQSTATGSAADTSNPSGPDAGVVLEACRDLLCADGHTVVILVPPAGGVYRDYARMIIPAARAAGLGYLRHLVVITEHAEQPPPERDDPGPGPARDGVQEGSRAESAPEPRPPLDLLVFILRSGCRP